MVASLFGARARRTGRRDRRTFRPSIDRLESRVALSVNPLNGNTLDTLSIGGVQTATFEDETGDIVRVSISGSAGTAVFRDAGNNVVTDGDNIASVTITGASPDFLLTVGASGLTPNATVKPLNGLGQVYLGRITADSVIRGVATVSSGYTIGGGGGPSIAIPAERVQFVLESFQGVNFSKGGGLFVDVVTGGEGDNLGILLSKGFSPYSTIAIREELDAVVLLGARNRAKADGRLLIESATAESIIYVNNSGDTSANSKLEILGGEGPFDAGVDFRGTFAGAVNLQSPAGGTWLFERGVAPGAVLSAASWVGRTVGAPVDSDGVVVDGDFAGTLTSTGVLLSDVSAAGPINGIGLAVGGNVAGTARVNSAGGLQLLVGRSVLPGAEFNAADACEMQVGGNFSGALSATAEGLLAQVVGNVSGAKLFASGNLNLVVGVPVASTAVNGKAQARSITNSSVLSGNDINLIVTGDVVKSSVVGRNINFSDMLQGGPESLGGVTVSALPEFGILGSVRNSTFTAGNELEGRVGGNVAGSVIQGQYGASLVVGGAVSKSRLMTTQEGGLVAQIGRDFQGSIQGGVANVGLLVGGSVLKGSTVATGGNAVVGVNNNFNGTVDVDELQFYVDGDVQKDARIVARRVAEWVEIEQQFHEGLMGGQNFSVGGRFDGILNVGVFDATADVQPPAPIQVIGGGAGSSARFYVGRFEGEADFIRFQGDFRGNIRVLGDLEANLLFIGDVDRITIGGEVLENIVVDGRLLSLISNSYFSPTVPGKQGAFLNGAFELTGSLVTRSYVTVLPLNPLPV